jgi:uncharacterized protein YdbL (DUF1318 family)
MPLLLFIMLSTFVLGVLWRPAPGWSLSLDEAKTQGLVGEQPNGYLGMVTPSATPDARALVQDINQKRRQTYEDIARRNATKLDAVEMLAGKTAIEQTKPGNFVQLPSGQWVQK